MVDAMISMVLERLAPVIEKRVRDEVNLVLYSSEEAEKLALKLKNIQKLLEDAENKRVTDRRVKAWLEKIEDAAYEMDDALDEWEWEMKSVELEMEGSQQQDNVSEIFWGKVSSFINSLCLCFQHSIERRRISLKIKELNGRLESIKKENDNEFNFFPNLPVDSQKIDQLDRKTTSYNDDLSEVTGPDDIKKELVSKLLSKGSQHENRIRIIAIVGTGGLGKTTLAQLAYRDSEVKEHFSLKSWICVSVTFDGIKIAKAILESLNEDSKDVTEFDTLLQRIESSISGKRFILVLDDVWTEDKEKWTPLKVCLDNGAPGSRILVTTRNKRVADMMGAQIQILNPLSDSDCWSLMSRIAFQGEKNNPKRLDSIGRKIAKKCAGLPLAAKTLGSHLSRKDTEQGWMNVLNSEVWTLDIARDKIFPPIYLSYKELRPAVKRCFSYCAIYPKDSKIEADTLIRMWMAQGFLSSAKEEMEQIGREYLEDLVTRSFFQDIEKHDLTGQIISCKMHDIIHDFAQYVTDGECVIVEIADDKEVSCPNARHLALIDPSYPRYTFSISGIENLKKLRSFIVDDCLPPKHVLGTLKCVRVLNLFNCDLKEVPPEMAKLVHLRYLDLSYNHDIRELPILCHLCNLQTLILDECSDLSTLPEEIYKLINLRHLIFYGSLPQGVEKLICLRTLTCFRAERGGAKLGCLKNLNRLEGRLKIWIDNLNEESDAIEAQNAELKKKTRLVGVDMIFDGEVSMNVMEALEPPPNLPALSLIGFGVEFPRWISASLKNLKSLRLENFQTLPPLGNLQSLESLIIRKVDHEFLRITDAGEALFPKLKELRFYRCVDWTEWEDIREEEENVVSIMPCLRTLSVGYCPKLKSLPHRLLRKTPLEYLYIGGSNLIIKKYRSGKLDEFLSPMCEVVID